MLILLLINVYFEDYCCVFQDKRQVSEDDGKFKADSLNVMFMETSAKTGHNVKRMFVRLASEITPEYYKQSDIPSSRMRKNFDTTTVILKPHEDISHSHEMTSRKRKFCLC